MEFTSRCVRGLRPVRLLACVASLVFVAACGPSSPSDRDAASKGSEPGATLPNGMDLLAAHAAACGGVAAAEAIRSLRIESRVEIGGQAINADAEYQWRNDGRFLQVQRIEGVGELASGFDGVDVWSQDPIYGDRVLSGLERAQALWLASPVSWAMYARYVEEATTKARRIVGDRTLYEVELKIKGGARATASFDEETKRLAELSIDMISPSGAQPVTVTFDAYRSVVGYEMAHVQTVKSTTGIIREEYRSVVANSPLGDRVFARRREAAAPAVRGSDFDGDGVADRRPTQTPLRQENPEAHNPGDVAKTPSEQP